MPRPRWPPAPGVRRLVWPNGASTAARLLTMDLDAFKADTRAAEECFGPLGLVVTYGDLTDVAEVLSRLPGQLTASLHAEENDDLGTLPAVLADRSGRVLWNQWPTGVSVTNAGGRYLTGRDHPQRRTRSAASPSRHRRRRGEW